MQDSNPEYVRIATDHGRAVTRLLSVPGASTLRLELADLTSRDLTACLDALGALKPRRLHLYDALLAKGDVARLLQSPACARLEELFIESGVPNGAPDWLPDEIVGAPLSVKRLGLWNCWLAGPGLRALSAAAAFTGLQHLSLGLNDPTLGAELGSFWEALLHLEKLALYACELAPDAAATLLDAPFAPRLQSLSLCGTDAGAAFWQALPRTTHLTRLERLNVNDSDFDDAAALALSRAEGLASLRELDLFFSPLGAAAATALLRSRHLPRLRRFVSGEQHDCGTSGWLDADHRVLRW
jgi:hypothetical protein